MSKSGPLNCGNVNMKGKKTKRLSCQCCECLDLRDKINEKIIKQELLFESNPIEAYNMSCDAALMEGCNWDMCHYWDLDILE